MTDKSNVFWTVYKKLEKDVVDLSYYIHFSDETSENGHNQLWTFSNQIADILIAISTQIESLFLELYNTEFNTKSEDIGAGINAIDKKWNLSAKQVKIISKNMYFTDTNGFGNEFAPMAYKPHDENDYYGAYCAVKHERINALHKANVNVLIRALAALFIFNIYYSFEALEIEEISDFDFTFNSSVFMAKYENDTASSNAVVIIDEDCEYLKKISEFAEAIPAFESGEFLKYKDEAKEPKRFTVKINKQEDTHNANT